MGKELRRVEIELEKEEKIKEREEKREQKKKEMEEKKRLKRVKDASVDSHLIHPGVVAESAWTAAIPKVTMLQVHQKSWGLLRGLLSQKRRRRRRRCDRALVVNAIQYFLLDSGMTLMMPMERSVKSVIILSLKVWQVIQCFGWSVVCGCTTAVHSRKITLLVSLHARIAQINQDCFST